MKKEVAGWTAIDVCASGLYGITVLPPRQLGNKPFVAKFGFVPCAGLSVESLTELAKKVSLPNCPWVLALGHGEYNLLVIPEPSVQQSELEQSVRWAVSTMIDSPLGTGSVDFMKIPTIERLPHRAPHLYAAFAKSETVSKINSVFQHAGIELESIDVRETAQRNIASLTESPEKGSVLLLINKQGVQLTITYNGSLFLDRFIEEALFIDDSHDADARERACERLILQLQRSLDFIGRTLPFIDVERVHVVSALGELDHAEIISQRLELPIEILDLTSVFDLSQTPDLQIRDAQPAYFTALGAAARLISSCQQLNLQVKREKNGLDLVWRELLAILLVLISLLIFWWQNQADVEAAHKRQLVSEQELQNAKNRLQQGLTQVGLDANVETLKQQAKAAREVLAQASGLGNQQGLAHYFALLTRITEKDLWLTDVVVGNAGKSIHLSGRAMDKESVLRYARQLNTQFAQYGVQFTSMEINSEMLGTQADGKPQLVVVSFKLY